MTDPSPDRLALHITDQRIVKQLGDLAPQIHLTFVSVLQGLALAVFFGALKPPASLTWAALRSALIANHLYLPYIGSFLLIVASWDAFTFNAFHIHWPLHSRSTALLLAFTLAEFGACSSAANVGVWTFWTGVTGIAAGLILYRNREIVSSNLYGLPGGKQSLYQTRTGDVRRSLTYFAIGILCPIGLLRAFDSSLPTIYVHIGNQAVDPVDYAVSVAVIVMLVCIIRGQDHLFTRYTQQVLETFHSPYQMREDGTLDESRMPA